MKRWSVRGLLIVAVIAVLCIGYTWKQAGNPASQTTPAPEEAVRQTVADAAPVVPVRTVVITRGTIQQTLTAYGTVISQPGEVQVISVPFECRVVHVLAVAGQQLSAGALLVEVEPSPDTTLQWEEANHAVATASKQLQQVQQRFEQRLVTKQEQFQAQQDLQSARITLANLEKRGIASRRNLVADLAGIVSKVNVQEGQIVPAGGSLVEVAVENRFEVRLGIEPEEVAFLKVDQPVSLFASDRGPLDEISGKLRLVTQRVNPETRLVDVFVSLPPDASLLLDQYVRGQLVIASEHTLVVPREAVIPDEGGYALYTINDDRAVKHTVVPGFQNAGMVSVRGDTLKEGQRVVIVGNYQLENGMAVTEAVGQ